MLSTLYYFAQVILCSGIMMLYYWLVLRDKKFHQYNRFYLLFTAAIAWIVPLIKIQWEPKPTGNLPMYELFYIVAENNSRIDSNLHRNWFQWNWQSMLTLGYALISVILLVSLLVSVVRIYRILKQHPINSIGDFFLIITNVKGTPFSFFSYIFWNEQIDIQSESGKQILQHEITHVQQKHSADKLFIQLVLIAGWFNPFFWLIKAEMSMIHEYIADKKSVENGDIAALAAMLLTAAYPQQQFLLSNPFFFSPIKRRIAMITNQTKPKYSYVRRLIILPLTAIILVLFAFRTKESRIEKPISLQGVIENVSEKMKNSLIESTTLVIAPTKDTTILSGDSVYVIPNGKEVKIIGSPTFVSSYPKLFNGSGKVKFSNSDKPLYISSFGDDRLVIVDGVKVDPKEMMAINESYILSIDVLKDKASTSLYGEEGKNGVIVITTKNHVGAVRVVSPLNIPKFYNESSPIFILDGKMIDSSDFKTINPNTIERIEVIKNGPKLEMYGEEGKNGVVLITSKKKGVFQGYPSPEVNKKPTDTDLAIIDFFKKAEFSESGTQLATRRGINGKETKIVIQRKNGVIESYDLAIPSEKLAAEAKYGSMDKLLAALESQPVSLDIVEDYPIQEKNVKVGQPITVYDAPDYGPNDLPAVMSAFFKKNPDIKNVYWSHSPLTMHVRLKNGSKESYDLTNASSIALAEKRYGKLPPAAPPPPPGKMPLELREVPVKVAEAVPLENVVEPIVVKGYKVTEKQVEASLVAKPEIPASFPGGKEAWQKYLDRNLKKDIVVEKGGPAGKYTVKVSFIVDPYGGISDVKALNNPGYGSATEAVRMIRKGPKWVPAQEKGKPVASRVVQSITYVVSEE